MYGSYARDSSHLPWGSTIFVFIVLESKARLSYLIGIHPYELLSLGIYAGCIVYGYYCVR